jgi:predicted ATP-binding protein involved in virulence
MLIDEAEGSETRTTNKPRSGGVKSKRPASSEHAALFYWHNGQAIVMVLDQIELANFRCFDHLLVKLDRHLNVFVGGNGAGKTAILDSVAMALSAILARFPFEKRAKIPPIGPSDIRSIAEDQSAPFAQISATGRANGSSPISWDRTRFRDQSPATLRESLTQRKGLAYVYHYTDQITNAQNNSRPYKLPVFAHYSTNRAVDVPHNKLQKRVMPRQFKRLAGLENALETKTDFRRAVGWFDLFEQRELRERRDNPASGTLPELDAVRRAVTLMVPGIRNPRIDGTNGRFAVDTTDTSGATVRLHLDQLSDGYQVVLGVVMDFALRLALANPPQTPGDDVLAGEAILIIDEVDLHLHPAWQQRVIPDLRRTFPNTQLILSTHSPQVATTVPSGSFGILRDSKLYSAPAGTEGAEAQRLLEDVFGVRPRPDLPAAQELLEYLRLVDERQWDSPRARELRRKLDEWSQGNEPRLLEADLQIANMAWEAGK